MATQADVVAAVQAALDTAQEFAGLPKTSDQLALLQAEVAQLTADKAALQTKIDNAKAAMAQADAADATEDAARKAAQDALA